jgi:hypothetical protein
MYKYLKFVLLFQPQHRIINIETHYHELIQKWLISEQIMYSDLYKINIDFRPPSDNFMLEKAKKNKYFCLFLAYICCLLLEGDQNLLFSNTSDNHVYWKFKIFKCLGLPGRVNNLICESLGCLIHFVWLTVFTWAGIMCL